MKKHVNEPFAQIGCKQINDFNTDAGYLGIEITLVIVTLNAILEEVLEFVVEKVGLDSKSKEANSVRFYAFIMYYFNSAIVMFLMGANLSIPIIGHWFQGQYRDFSDQWFVIIGS